MHDYIGVGVLGGYLVDATGPVRRVAEDAQFFLFFFIFFVFCCCCCSRGSLVLQSISQPFKHSRGIHQHVIGKLESDAFPLTCTDFADGALDFILQIQLFFG